MKQSILGLILVLAAYLLYVAFADMPERPGIGTVASDYEDILIRASGEQPEELSLNALSACVVDAANGRVLYGKNATEVRAMASTTKIMTCLLALEHCQMDEVVTVSKYAASQPPVQLNINTGEQYLLKDLLYSMMMESHNDSAVAVAEHVAGSEEAFCEMMTKRAKELGATETSFGSANGLDRGEHHTTAEDLCRIASTAVKNQEFLKIVTCDTHTFSDVSGKRNYFLSNINKYLYMDRAALGMKTGFTNKAGYCFVGATRYEDTILISSVLGSGWPPHKQYKWNDTKALVSYVREHFHTEHLEVREQMLGKLAVLNAWEPMVSVALRDGTFEELLLGTWEDVTIAYEFSKEIFAPIESGDVLGVARIYIDEQLYREMDIVACADVAQQAYRDYLNFLLDGLW